MTNEERIQTAEAMLAYYKAPVDKKPAIELLVGDGYQWSFIGGEPSWTPEYRYRLAQEPAPAIAEGHNPAKLTVDQIPAGRRLMTREEVARRNGESPPCADIHGWVESGWNMGAHVGYHINTTYSVPIDWKDPLLKKKVRKPCGPEHFPPGTVVREIVKYEPNKEWLAIICMTEFWLRIGFQRDSTPFDSPTFMNQYERSLDGGKTWLPCFVEVEE